MSRKIGRYEIYEKIGSGAFGEVYRGHDPEVKRPVAVKVLSALSDLDNLARFRREAAAAGNLHHPNIVTIYDSGENEGVPFIVMELVDGLDLQRVQAKGTLSLLEKVEIMYQVADGLHYAHANQIVHRDVKPANIMVLTGNAVKILDFGIARLTHQAERHTRAGFMVGTILYMSPEQFGDGTVDALCDVWAYGVVYYELLTGKHPFEAKDNAGLMYKVTRVDPPRIRTLAPDVPESLEQLVHRALARDRELRYQGLDDLQLDAHPLLMELRRQRASLLINDAQSAFDAGQLEEAMATVRRILDLDPGKVEARRLRDQISKQMQQFKVRPKVDALLKNAEQEISERRFGEAIEALESAHRLDQNDSGIRVRLDEARRLAESSTRAAELVRRAEKSYRLREFPTAFRLCAEALRHDEHHPQAQRLMATIQQEMGKQDHQRRRADLLERVRGLLAMQSYEEVFAAIESLRAEFPGDAEVEQLAATAKTRHDERTRRNRLRQEMDAARQLLKEEQFAQVVERLQGLQSEFATDQQFAELLAYAQDELARQKKDQDISDLVQRSSQAQAQNRFDDALKFVAQGMQKYVGDGILMRQFQTIMAAKTAFEKTQAIADAVERVAGLRRDGRVVDALNVIEGAIRSHGAEPKLVELRGELDIERQQLERVESIRDAVRQAEALLRQRHAAKAISGLEAALGKYPDSTELRDLHAKAVEANRHEERRRFLDERLAQVAQLEKTEEWDAALAVIDETLAVYPDAAELVDVSARLEEGRRAAAALKESALAKLQIERAMRARDWNGAAGLLGQAAGKLPAADLAALRRQLETAQNQAALEALVAEAQDALTRGDLQTARDLIESGEIQYGRQEALSRLRPLLERETSFRDHMAAAQQALADRMFTAARDSVRKALELKPADAEAVALRGRIDTERQSAERAQALASGKEKVARLLEDKQFEKAITELDSLIALSPGDTDLRALRGQAVRSKTEADRERAEREAKERALREARAQADREAAARAEKERAQQEEKRRIEQQFAADARQFDTMLESDQLDAATQVLERSKLVLGNDPRLRPLQDRLTGAVAVKQRRDEIQRLCGEARDLMSRGRFDEALKLLEGAAVRFPDAQEFPGLLAEAEQGRQNALRRQAIEQSLAEAAALVEKGQPEKALATLDDKLRRYPDSRELAEAAARLRTRVQASARQREVGDATQSIERLIAEKKWTQALASVEAAEQQYPDATAFAGLKRNIELARRQADMEATVAAVAEAQRQGNLALAAELVAAARARYPDEQRLNRMFYEIDAAIAEGSLAQARPLIDAGRFDEAETLAREALARRPKLPAAQDLLTEIASRKAERLRQQRMRERAILEVRGGQRSYRGPIMGASAVVVAVLAGVAWWKLRPEPPPPGVPPSILEKWDHPTAVRGEPYAGTLRANGGALPRTWTLVRGTLPAGVGLDPQTGLIEGTPTADGVYPFMAQVSDRDGLTAQREFTITVKAPPVRPVDAKLVIENSGAQWTTTKGTRFSEYLRASGGSPPVTWAWQRRLPQGISLDSNTGHVHGTAAEDGVFAFTVKATDRAGHSVEGNFGITVKAKEDITVIPPPAVMDSGVPVSAVRGEPYSAALRATGGSGGVTWSAAGLPKGLNLDPNTGRIDGAFPSEGAITFVAKATDRAGKTGERAFNVTVKAPKEVQPPCQMIPFNFNTFSGSPEGTLTWSGTLPTGADLTINKRSVTPGFFQGAPSYLPGDGAHVKVEVSPKMRIMEQPSARNCWAPRLVLRNDGPAVSSIIITWRVVP